jgi:hypothetical protein
MNLSKEKFQRNILISMLFFGLALQLQAVGQNKDSLIVASKKRANKAALMSAVIPGAGQIYNKKYWKVPIIYAGGATLIYFISVNNTEFKKYSDAIIYRNDNDSMTVDDYPRYTNEDLLVRKNYYRRNRDLCYIFVGVLYTLNIIDAYVDSQLMDFDVGDDLSLHSGGTINYLSDGSPVLSLQLVLNFK